MDRDDLPGILRRLEHHRERHAERGLVLRILWVLAGFVVLAVGLAMVVLPGPAVVVIPLGLAMLSFEFAWAERLLATSVRRSVQAKRKAAEASRRSAVAAAAGVVLVLAAVVAAIALYL
jgi:uncharacterized protein (TIGR02611 family)